MLTNNDVEQKRKESLKELIELIAQNNDPDFLTSFFSCLFTPTELHDIANRWILVNEIDNGVAQREIAKVFGMSLCKITRGSRELKKEDSAFQKMLSKAKKMRASKHQK